MLVRRSALHEPTNIWARHGEQAGRGPGAAHSEGRRASGEMHLLHAHALADLEEQVEAGAYELHGLGLRGVGEVLHVVAAHESEDLRLDERHQPLLPIAAPNRGTRVSRWEGGADGCACVWFGCVCVCVCVCVVWACGVCGGWGGATAGACMRAESAPVG